VDDVRDLVLVERASERTDVGHVAADERHPLARRLVQREPEAGFVLAEVVADRLVAELEQRRDRPGPEAAERARDQCPFRQAARPGRR